SVAAGCCQQCPTFLRNRRKRARRRRRAAAAKVNCSISPPCPSAPISRPATSSAARNAPRCSGWSAASSAASSRAQLAVRARLVDRRRQMVGQKLEHLIGRHAEFRRQLLHALLAKRGAQLLGRHRQISAVAEPRLHLRAEAALLQLIDDALQVTEVGLLERFRDQGRRGGRRDIAQRAAQTVQQSHYLSSSLVMPLTDVSRSWRRACPALRRPARTCRRPAWCG